MIQNVETPTLIMIGEAGARVRDRQRPERIGR